MSAGMNDAPPLNSDSIPRPDAPAPGATEAFERLREMFQLDRGDLDFGLYRIMNLKRAEVERFLREDLLPPVRELLGVSLERSRDEVRKELAETELRAREFGFDPKAAPNVKRLRAELEGLSLVRRAR